jgi:hypothetical protein
VADADTPRRSTLAHDITRYALARPRAGFSAAPRGPFLPWMLPARVASVCFRDFICMLPVFYVDVAKIDRDIAYVVMAIHYVANVCFRRMLYVFYLGVAYVSHLCCKCFIRMLHIFSARISLVFETYVASVLAILDVCYKYLL